MNHKLLLSLFSAFVCIFYIQAEPPQTIHVNEAGSLNTLLSLDKAKVTTLVLTGIINDTDFSTIKEMENLKTLDISKVDIDNGIIPSEAFANSAIRNLLLPISLKAVGDRAFNNTVLSSLDFSVCPNLQKLGAEVFSKTILDNSTLDFSKNRKLTKFESLVRHDYHLGTFSNFQGTVILPNNLEIIPEATFSSFDGYVAIPDSVKEIGRFAFCHVKLGNDLILPKSLERVNYKAFAWITVSALDFSVCPDLEELGPEVFFNASIKSSVLDFSTNTKLTKFGSLIWNDYHLGTFSNFYGNVILTNNLEVIPEATFSCFTGTIDIPNSVKEIGRFAFCRARLKGDLILPTSLEKVDYKAFACISIPSLDFSACSNLQELDQEVFFNTKITTGLLDFSTNNKLVSFKSGVWNKYTLGTFSNYQGDVVLPYNLKIIPDATFSCFNGYVAIPDSIEKIEALAFSRARLKKEFILPSSLTRIENKAFFYSTIKEIDLPESLTFIGDSAFANCDKLIEIISNNPTPPSLGSSVFSGVNISSCNLYVPRRSPSLYATADQWKDFITSTKNTVESKSLIESRSIEDETTVSFYPNPTTDVLNISGNNIENIQIYNTSGKLVKSEGNSNPVNIQDLSSGIYIIKVTTPTGIVTDKVMKK